MPNAPNLTMANVQALLAAAVALLNSAQLAAHQPELFEDSSIGRRDLKLAREILGSAAAPTSTRGAFSREVLDEIDRCTCVTYCKEHPKTACRLDGTPHVHPASQGPGFGPCPVHPDRPGDH